MDHEKSRSIHSLFGNDSWSQHGLPSAATNWYAISTCTTDRDRQMHTNMLVHMYVHTYHTHSTHTHTHTTCTHTDTLMYLYKRCILLTCALQVCMVYKYCAHYTHNNAQNLLVISLVCRYSSEVMGEQAVSPPR